MKVILSYHASCGIDLLTYNNGVETIRKECWLYDLVDKKYNNKSIKFLGRDELKRVEIEMDLYLFEELKNDTLFIMKAEKLRRLQTDRKYLIEYLTTCHINLIDNDLDEEERLQIIDSLK